ncbi:hypothetical protein H112_05442 [Trichophyton rubrum D6]|uniref:Uncharacterized protein n=3 Tax=Trichophyton TaxID=5550 RepID=F2SJH4_TRIRC|nr:uncharacterized protein TERG_03181 [Trichophyton rubrum CBS 118892]EZF17160.1 hypothetical protein H100_05459 [Trichophyton rubrum MR850]EZF40569.1 hypothetical protein H102_05425 [Trichophyton rubrum CBS 100081]EZF51238.1 hypothetical protein H103_05452 [Trichophyton rubrum CBS 288.86]EZF61763.1 hypothetical protein H104_05441 [Trichophyton rubrum CBS 289.86]EZF72421.1 hypothetical protein H105_05468 [Trichophyton soudanense CBS 452.61]EZF83129.1 hypothetical protein H110_05448 [Trichophy
MKSLLLALLVFVSAAAAAASAVDVPLVPCQTPEGRGICQVTGRCFGTSKWYLSPRSGSAGGMESDTDSCRHPSCPITGRCCISPLARREEPDECSSPAPNSCSFYSACLEKGIPCGPDGYALAYGDRYCNRFSAASPQLSASGQEWVTKTMLCLQQKLVPVALGKDEQVSTCPAVREFAFSTHPECYIQGGVCLLAPTDWLVIVGTVGFTELFDSVEALATTLKTVKGCLDFYLWLIRNNFIHQPLDLNSVQSN